MCNSALQMIDLSHLEDVPQLLGYLPLTRTELTLAQPIREVSCDPVIHDLVLDCHCQHVVR